MLALALLSQEPVDTENFDPAQEALWQGLEAGFASAAGGYLIYGFWHSWPHSIADQYEPPTPEPQDLLSHYKEMTLTTGLSFLLVEPGFILLDKPLPSKYRALQALLAAGVCLAGVLVSWEFRKLGEAR